MVAIDGQLPSPASELQRLQTLFAVQKRAFKHNSMPSADMRLEQLRKLKAAMIRHQESLTHAVNEDFSCRAKDETLVTEIMTTVQSLTYMIKNVRKWMRPSRRHVNIMFMPSSNKVFYQPLGVIGIMVPWNYPIMLSIIPLATAIAAGNRAMIKMSEFTPAVSTVIKTLLMDVFDEEYVAIIEGEIEVSTVFSEIPWDHLIFTGSTAVGKHIMAAAAKNLTPVTLELGGKSPAIIAPGANMDDAVRRLCFGKSINAGQTCIAPDYLLLPEGKQKEFIEKYNQFFAHLYPTIRGNDDYTAIINDQQYKRLISWLKDAREKGAVITQMNPASESFTGTRKMPLHIVENLSDEMIIMQEELFGPILPIVPYSSFDEALNYVNDRGRPLALYLFSYDRDIEKKVLENTHAGGVSVNDTLVHIAQDDMPFGGVGPSGMGHYHGKEGFISLSKAKAVHRKGRFSSGRFIYPPYGTSIQKLIYKLFIR